jgi:hypothetical protein
MKRINSLLLVGITILFLTGNQLYSQEKKDLRKEYLSKNFFQSYGGMFAFEFGTNNVGVYNQSQLLNREQRYETHGVFVVGVYSPRINVYNHKDFASISIACPLRVGLYVKGDMGLGVKVPLFVDFNFFAHSTYNNINRKGFFIGFGGQFVSIRWFEEQFPSSEQSQFWFGDLIRVGAKLPIKGKYYGAYFTLPMTGLFRKNEMSKEDRAQSLGLNYQLKNQDMSLTITRLINYD